MPKNGNSFIPIPGLGLEFTEQVPELDMMILPIGGGGLCGGFAAAVKQSWPNCKVYTYHNVYTLSYTDQ